MQRLEGSLGHPMTKCILFALFFVKYKYIFLCGWLGTFREMSETYFYGGLGDVAIRWATPGPTLFCSSNFLTNFIYFFSEFDWGLLEYWTYFFNLNVVI